MWWHMTTLRYEIFRKQLSIFSVQHAKCKTKYKVQDAKARRSPQFNKKNRPKYLFILLIKTTIQQKGEHRRSHTTIFTLVKVILLPSFAPISKLLAQWNRINWNFVPTQQQNKAVRISKNPDFHLCRRCFCIYLFSLVMCCRVIKNNENALHDLILLWAADRECEQQQHCVKYCVRAFSIERRPHFRQSPPLRFKYVVDNMANIHVETMEGTSIWLEIEHYKCSISHCRMLCPNVFVSFQSSEWRK